MGSMDRQLTVSSHSIYSMLSTHDFSFAAKETCDQLKTHWSKVLRFNSSSL